MKKLISVFSVALVLVFSCVLTSFADDSVVSGYAVDNVPYSSSFDGVLTSSDSGSQLYSSSENKTYRSSSVLSAPSSSVQSLYTSKSVVNMIPQNTWRISDGASKTFPVEDGFVGVQFNWDSGASPSAPHSISHLTNIRSFDFFKSERKYRITFDLIINSNSKGTFTFDIVSTSDTSQVVIPLCSVQARVGSAETLGQGSRSYSIELTLPSGIDSLLQPKVSVSLLTGSEFLFFINDFTVTDITTEDLDKSLDRLGDKIDNSINPSVPYDKWDDGSFKDSAGKLKDAENNLPTVDFGAIEELKNSIDISSYSHAFASINQLFIRLVDTVGITPLIFFACFFGFCIFLIGRRLSGG